MAGAGERATPGATPGATRKGAGRYAAAALLIVAALVQSACALNILPGGRVTIHGHVFGDPLVTSLAAASTAHGPAPLRAIVDCNDVTATSGADGAFTLALDQAGQYTCTISAPPDYVAANVTIPGAAARGLDLEVGPSADTVTCAAPTKAGLVACPVLHLRPGTLNGLVTAASSNQPASGVAVACWQPSAHASQRSLLTARAGATGAFSLPAVPPGAYACTAGDDPSLREGVVAPGATGTVGLTLCDRQCPALRFHGHAVVHHLTAYVIFWLPAGHTFEPGGGDARFQSLVQQYFNDVGGTDFYGMLGQYWDYQGFMQNSVTLGGTYVDTTPYPRAGTRAAPLTDADIQAGVARAQQKNGWIVDGEHAYFLFTGYNVESCSMSVLSKECSFSTNGRHYCAYHSAFEPSATFDDAIYAYVPVLADCADLNGYASPNHDAIADATINSLSHEHFEAVTDPDGLGWYDGDSSRGEIGDKCEYRFGTTLPGGGNVTLAHGHTYLLQMEWSNRAGACALR